MENAFEINSPKENEFDDNQFKPIENKPLKKVKFGSENLLFSILFVFSIAFLFSVYYLNIYVTPIRVVGASMQPTINASVYSDSDREHCDIVYYKKQEFYNNGEIIIMHNTDQKYINDQNVNYLIKRVIACPGDTIKFIPTNYPTTGINAKMYFKIEVYNKENQLIIDEENYIKEEMFYKNNEENMIHSIASETFGFIFSSIKYGQTAEIEIEENQYFVMGDNRNNSSDSRIFGTVNYDDISGRVELQVPYGQTLIQSLFDKMKLLLERCL